MLNRYFFSSLKLKQLINQSASGVYKVKQERLLTKSVNEEKNGKLNIYELVDKIITISPCILYSL